LEENQHSGSYIPGQCNIGPEEIDRRKRNGYLGLAGMAIFIILDLNFHFPQIWKLLLIAPTVYALSGFVQARSKFCYAFGLLGLFSFTGKRIKVHDDLQVKQDRNKSLWLIAQIFIGSLIVTLAYYTLT
jgi:hypothetical protein